MGSSASTIGGAAASGSLAGYAAFAALGPVGAAVAAIPALITIGRAIASMTGCGMTCVQAAGFADRVEPLLRGNRDTFLAVGNPTFADKSQALANADALYAALYQNCSNPALGDAGKRCISERLQRGGSAPWCPSGTGCDWYTLYRKPIEDVTVGPSPGVAGSIAGAGAVVATEAIALGVPASVASYVPWIILGGLAILIVARIP